MRGRSNGRQLRHAVRQECSQPSGNAPALLEMPVKLPRAANGARQDFHVRDKGDEPAGAKLPCDDQVGAVPDDEHDTEQFHEVKDRNEKTLDATLACLKLDHPPVGSIKALDLMTLVGERLNGPNSR